VLALRNGVHAGLARPLVTGKERGEGRKVPVESVPGPVHTVPAHPPCTNRYPPETTFTQIVWRVLIASIFARISEPWISRAPHVTVAPGRALKSQGTAADAMIPMIATTTTSSDRA